MWSVIEAVHRTNPKEEVKSLPRGELRGRPWGKEWGGDTALGEFESNIPHSHNSLKSHRHGTHIFRLRVSYSFQGCCYVQFNVAYIKCYVDIGKNGYLTLTQKKTLWYVVQVLQLLLCLHPWLRWKLKLRQGNLVFACCSNSHIGEKHVHKKNWWKSRGTCVSSHEQKSTIFTLQHIFDQRLYVNQITSSWMSINNTLKHNHERSQNLIMMVNMIQRSQAL